MSISSRLLQGVSLSILSLACAAAFADTQLDHSSLVRYSDLNLQRPSDVAKLYQRIASAADRVCGPRSLTGAYSKSAVYASCFDDTVAQAVARVNQTPLTLYYEQRVQHAAPALAVASK